MLIVYKAQNGVAPDYIQDLCVPVSTVSTRSALRSAARGTVILTINESVGSDCNRLFRRRQLRCYQSRWIVFSWAYDRCLATRSLAARCLAKSLKVIENGTIHRSHTSSYSFSIANYHGHICIFYPSFSSVTLDTITHATTLHYRPTSIPKWSEILVETRQFLIIPLPLNLNVDI